MQEFPYVRIFKLQSLSDRVLGVFFVDVNEKGPHFRFRLRKRRPFSFSLTVKDRPYGWTRTIFVSAGRKDGQPGKRHL